MGTRARAIPAAMLLAGFGLAGAAGAYEGGPSGPGGFGQGGPRHELEFAVIDANGDGLIGREELVGRAVERLTAFDVNGDGTLDRDEIVAAMPARRSFFDLFAEAPSQAMADRMLERHGALEQGQIEIATVAEQRADALMTEMDQDDDGALSPDEAAASGMRHAGRGHRDGHGHGSGHGEGGHGGHQGPRF